MNLPTTTKPGATKPQHDRCLYCGQEAGLVWVHGHGQCIACGTNVDECCRGEHCFVDDQNEKSGVD